MPDLSHLANQAAAAKRGAPPVHLWNPPFCGDIDMRIAADGTWFYMGTPIGRPALVRLFASILRKDEERYVLVTPVEKVGLQVEDAPFVAVEMEAVGVGAEQILRFRTNVDDWIEAGPDHPLRFEQADADGLKPYVHVRAGLWARVTRSLLYDLAELGETRAINGRDMFGIVSGSGFFVMSDAVPIANL